MWKLLFVKTAVVTLAALARAASARRQSLPGGFVFLRDIDPSILQDIRYAVTLRLLSIPTGAYARLHGLYRRPRAGRRRRYGTGYDCSDPKAHTAALSITAAQRRWRKPLGVRHGPARLCELFEGVMALFTAGRGRGGL